MRVSAETLMSWWIRLGCSGDIGADNFSAKPEAYRGDTPHSEAAPFVKSAAAAEASSWGPAGHPPVQPCPAAAALKPG